MHKRILGNGFEVSSIGLGCMGFSHGYGVAMDDVQAISMIQKAYEMGYTLFDTAEVYGSQMDPHHNEKLVGHALKDVRDKVQIISKFGIQFDMTSDQVNHPLIPDSKPSTIRSSIENTLERLQTDHLDLYLQHRIDPNTEPEIVAETMSKLIQEGKILHWGISEANEEYLRRAHKICPVTAVENRYSMMARSYEALFPVLEELKIGFIAFSPLANGFLSGKYGKEASFDKKYDYRSNMPQFTKKAIDQNQELLFLLNDLAIKKKATPAQISLAWMLCKKPWIVPIPGTRKLDRLKENLLASQIDLTEQEVKNIDQALDHMSMSSVFGGSRISDEA